MKYSSQFYELLAHINPAMYDVIYPMGPLTAVSGAVQKERERKELFYIQVPGSVMGTDFSGDLSVPVRFSWVMKDLIQNLHAITLQAKLSPERVSAAGGTSTFISELIDEHCGNGPRVHFPPKPHFYNNKLTIEEKAAAASLFAQAAASVEGTEIGRLLSDGADKILDSAFAQLSKVAIKANNGAFNHIATPA